MAPLRRRYRDLVAIGALDALLCRRDALGDRAQLGAQLFWLLVPIAGLILIILRLGDPSRDVLVDHPLPSDAAAPRI